MILVGGENLIDFIQDPPDGGWPAYRAVPGGAPFNVAKAVARQGPEVGYMTPFSTDTLGKLLADDLGREANVTFLAPFSEKPTSLAVVSLTDGQARYQFYRERTAERDVTAEGLLATVPEGARAFFVGGLALADGADAEAWTQVLETLAARGLFTAVDPNIRPAFIHDRAAYMARLERILAVADLVKFSDEDLAWLAPGEDAHAATRAIADRAAAGLVVATLGSKGATAVAGFGTLEVPAHPVEVLKDTVGAGDTFMGTLLAQAQRLGLLTRGGLAEVREDAARELLELAAKAAAINCGRVGCDPPGAGVLGTPLAR